MSKRFRVRFAYDAEVDADSPYHAIQLATLQIAEDIPDDQIVSDLVAVEAEEVTVEEAE